MVPSLPADDAHSGVDTRADGGGSEDLSARHRQKSGGGRRRGRGEHAYVHAIPRQRAGVEAGRRSGGGSAAWQDPGGAEVELGAKSLEA